MPIISWRIGAAILAAGCSYAATFNVKDFGAAGDGKKKDTAAIARAIDACAKPGDVFPVSVGTPRFRDFHFSNITARGSKSAGQITGLKEMPVENLTFSGVQIRAQTGMKITNARDVVFQDVVIETEQGDGVSVTDSVGIDMTRLRQIRK